MLASLLAGFTRTMPFAFGWCAPARIRGDLPTVKPPLTCAARASIPRRSRLKPRALTSAPSPHAAHQVNPYGAQHSVPQPEMAHQARSPLVPSLPALAPLPLRAPPGPRPPSAHSRHPAPARPSVLLPPGPSGSSGALASPAARRPGAPPRTASSTPPGWPSSSPSPPSASSGALCFLRARLRRPTTATGCVPKPRPPPGRAAARELTPGRNPRRSPATQLRPVPGAPAADGAQGHAQPPPEAAALPAPGAGDPRRVCGCVCVGGPGRCPLQIARLLSLSVFLHVGACACAGWLMNVFWWRLLCRIIMRGPKAAAKGGASKGAGAGAASASGGGGAAAVAIDKSPAKSSPGGGAGGGAGAGKK